MPFVCLHTHEHAHTHFGYLLLQIRPWEYLCHQSTQIKAVNRDPGVIEKDLPIFFSPRQHVCVCWQCNPIRTFAFMCIAVRGMCEKWGKTHQWRLHWSGIHPVFSLTGCYSVGGMEKRKKKHTPCTCTVARSLFTC